MDPSARADEDRWLRTGSGGYVKPGFHECATTPNGAPTGGGGGKWLWHFRGLAHYAHWLNGGPPWT